MLTIICKGVQFRYTMASVSSVFCTKYFKILHKVIYIYMPPVLYHKEQFLIKMEFDLNVLVYKLDICKLYKPVFLVDSLQQTYISSSLQCSFVTGVMFVYCNPCERSRLLYFMHCISHLEDNCNRLKQLFQKSLFQFACAILLLWCRLLTCSQQIRDASVMVISSVPQDVVAFA